jgi:hypothetical protein
MAIHFYHPNKAVKGFAASFWYSDRDDTIFATILRQSGWDDKAQNGIFKGSIDDPNGKVNIKLSYVEIAAFLDCIERNRPFKGFHDHDQTPKAITFAPWLDAANNNTPKGYSFSITVTNKQDSSQKNAFYIGFTFAEARLIREFFVYTLHSHFNRVRANPKYAPPPKPVPANESNIDPLVEF